MVNIRAEMQSGVYDATSLLQTKFAAPPLRDDIVPRPRLSKLINEGMKHPVVLISAPAGFGKSTVIAEWQASLAVKHFPVAWLSLEEDDSEITRFLTYFIGALETIIPDIGRDLFPLLQAAQPPPPKSTLTVLINRLSESRTEFAMVLDDYHTILTQSVHDALTYLLDHMPPSMHLIITSRADPPLPLSRMRVRAQLTEIRADDLRFGHDEASDFLSRVFGLKPSEAEIHALGERTEGWAAGLQLAALAMRGREDLSGFIEAFTGNHRYIVDYLIEEVLSRQPEQVYHFLLQTSILDRMSADVCQAVTGQDDAQEMLEYLEHANLFIIPLDQNGRWYRYHHLFGSVLRHRLRHNHPAAELHIRASDWFKREGLLDEAVRHALEAPDMDRVAVIIESVSLAREEQASLTHVRTWLKQMPFEYIQSRPRLMIAYCWIVAILEDHSKVEALITGVPSLNVPDLAAEIKGIVALLRANVARWQDQDKAALELARQSLAYLPENGVSYRVYAINTIVTAHLHLGNLIEARQAVDEGMALTAGNPAAMMWMLFIFNVLLWWDGQTRQIIENGERVLRMVLRERSQVLSASVSQIFIAMMSYELNDLSRAEANALRGIEVTRFSAEYYMLTYAYVCLSCIYLARGEFDRALEAIDRGEVWFAEMQVGGISSLQILAAQRARVWIAQGDLNAALDWANQPHTEVTNSSMRYHQEFTLARLNLARHRRSHDKSLLMETTVLLEQILDQVQSSKWTAKIIECLILQALTFDAMGDSAHAMASLKQALILTEPREYVRTYLDEGAPMRALLKLALAHGITPEYTKKLLAAFDQPPPPALTMPARIESLIEPLSERELEILRLIEEGESNREIAARLYISLGTVKKHVNNIFSKLDVQSRTQAVAAARDQHIL